MWPWSSWEERFSKLQNPNLNGKLSGEWIFSKWCDLEIDFSSIRMDMLIESLQEELLTFFGVEFFIFLMLCWEMAFQYSWRPGCVLTVGTFMKSYIVFIRNILFILATSFVWSLSFACKTSSDPSSANIFSFSTEILFRLLLTSCLYEQLSPNLQLL